MLLGDLIMNVRSLGPDPPQVGIAPTLTSLVPAVGGTLTAGTYYIVLTAVNNWGETVASVEQSVVLAGPNNAITVNYSATPGLTGIRVYVGFTAGQELSYIPFSTTASGAVTLTTIGTLVAGSPPVNSSFSYPDADGGFVSAATMYRWLNDALKAASRITGGIQDACGVASVSGNRRYTIPGQWLKLNQCFYDGWELDLGNKAETFRNRNLTANISISLMVDAQSDTTRMELYWTPSRTSGTALISAPILASDVTIPIGGVSGWLLEDGYALLSDGTNSEIVTYSAQTGSALTGAIRGWAGTQPFAFAATATVTELNIELNGYRMPYVYSVGQSGVVLGVPPGWEPFLKDYLLGTFREAEQESQEAQGLKDRAAKGLEAWVKSNKPVAGPRQMRMYGDYGLRGTVPGGLTGPLIIP